MLQNVLNHISVGCPTQIRADHGTENGLVAATQICFLSTGTDSLAGSKSFRYGTSPANVVRTMCIQFLVKKIIATMSYFIEN